MSTPTSKSPITIARKLDALHGNLVEEFVNRMRNKENAEAVFTELNNKYVWACVECNVDIESRQRFAKSITHLLQSTQDVEKRALWQHRMTKLISIAIVVFGAVALVAIFLFVGHLAMEMG